MRLTSHSSDDDQRRYRDPAEVDALKERDPIPQFAGELRAAGVLTDERDEALRAEVKAEVNEASKRAEARPEPTADDAHERVYAEPIPGGGTAVPLDADQRRGALTMAELNILEAIRRRWTRRWSATTASWSSARTSARRAACSAPPRACGPSTATSACSTRRSPRA